MAAIRVTIGDMPLLLRSLVEGMLHEDPQVEIVAGENPGPGERARPVQVLIVSEEAMNGILPGIGPLAELPPTDAMLGVVAIAADGLDAAVVRVNAKRTRIDAPRHTLSDAIRDAAGILPAAH